MTERERINEKMTMARLSLQSARKSIQEANAIACSSQDETLNMAIPAHCFDIMTQLLGYIEEWREEVQA